MAQDNFGSPGVTAKEIDNTFASTPVPSGIPAGVIGTAKRGPAFVPVTVSSMAEFIRRFGDLENGDFGPLAVQEWLRSAESACYLRVLGVGDGTQRTSSGNNAGKVARAGFVVGDELVQANGNLGANPFAVANGVPGRTYMLGCFMSESNGSTYFTEAGLNAEFTSKAVTLGLARPILRGVLMAASGVTLTLSGTDNGSSDAPYTANAAATVFGPEGSQTGSVDIVTSEFKLFLNGLDDTATEAKSVVAASFNENSSSYFANVFNRNPAQLEEKGHLLYTYYDVPTQFAILTGTGVVSESYTPETATNLHPLAFLLTSSLGRNSGSTTVPNFENFEDRYRTPESPWVISQEFGGSPSNLFKIHSLDAGAWANEKVKISVSQLKPSSDDIYKYGSFTLQVRAFDDIDKDVRVLETFSNLSLDPDADNYIGAKIGDMNSYWDFDAAKRSQRLVIDGRYPNRSNYIRVQMNANVEDKATNSEALPLGFRGPRHLVTSGSSIVGLPLNGSSTAGVLSGTFGHHTNLVVPPIPFRNKISNGTGNGEKVQPKYFWGVMFEKKATLSQENGTQDFNQSIKSYTKYFPRFHTDWRDAWLGDNAGTADSGGTILDSDTFNNNKFTLERVQVVTGSDTNANPIEGDQWQYVREGGIIASTTAKTRGMLVSDLESSRNRKLLKYSFFLQGGYDGVNVFDAQKSALTNTAAVREIGETDQGLRDGPTVAAYLRALDVIGNTSDVDIQVLALPGIREATITDQAVTTTEDRFDAIYLMDVEEFDTLGVEITGSVQLPDVAQTVTQFNSRGLDSSFAAAYFPDVNISVNDETHSVPPSVAVLGSYAFTDATEFPWRAPAGLKRGNLKSATSTAVLLNQTNLDSLYDADINPIVSFPGSDAVTVWGQKTLQAAQTSLDRVNVRRLLIELRRQVRAIARRLIFEPNRAATLAAFENAVRPRLASIKRNLGIERFKVKVDTTTTTQADVENNTVRGKIWIQPTRTAEFISLDFVVSNTIEE